MADTGWGPRRWVIDPIDGTKNFVRGVPVWATLIALDDQRRGGRRRGERASAGPPLVGEPWQRCVRRQVLDVGHPMHVSDVADDGGCVAVSYASHLGLGRVAPGPAVRRPARRCWRTRAYGDFWSYMLLAEGGVDMPASPSWRCTTWRRVRIIVTEAGGKFTDLDGRPGPLGTGGYATNGRLHDAVLAQLALDDDGHDDDPDDHDQGIGTPA